MDKSMNNIFYVACNYLCMPSLHVNKLGHGGLSISHFRMALQWRHNECDGVSNHRRLGGLFNREFRRRWKKHQSSVLLAFCERNSPVTGEFPAQRASNAENVSHHVKYYSSTACLVISGGERSSERLFDAAFSSRARDKNQGCFE